MVISFEEAEDDFREEDDDDGEDRLVAAEFGLALADCWLALPFAFGLFFGSGLDALLRVDISERGMVMYCWTPSGKKRMK